MHRKFDAEHLCIFFIMLRPPPISTLFPYTTLFRSYVILAHEIIIIDEGDISPKGNAQEVIAFFADGAPFEKRDNLLRIADRKSTRLNSSHPSISYAVFCLKKKKNNKQIEKYRKLIM